MLITNPEILKKYTREKRLWQGIPSIEVTKKGRIFLTFYSGGVKEEIGNYSFIVKSDDGVNFSEPIVAAFEENYRCFDPCLWIDPLDRLWFTWSRCPDDGLWAAICDDPDAETLTFGKEFFVGHNVMMNKPTVLSTGEWLFPIAVWNNGVRVLPKEYDSLIEEKGAFAYITEDEGKTFKKSSPADVKDRSFDEHMILEMEDGSLRMFVRTRYGIGATNSFDGGRHWGKDFDSGYGGPCSRFFIRRLKSGRILLINHYNFSGRNNLYAMLSTDDGKTFPHKLLLDERSNIAYPDAKEAEDGYIYITYDRERGSFLSKLEDVMNSAREILIARITEEDIIKGELTNKGSFLKRVADKLTEYKGEMKNPFCEEKLFNDEDYACHLSENKTPEMAINEILSVYSINCANIHNIDAMTFDELIDAYNKDQSIDTLSNIIALVRSASDVKECSESGIVEEICKYMKENLEENETAEDLARRFNFSVNYLSHIFKVHTGTTILNYRNSQRLIKAKLLLKGCDSKIIDIAASCGFENPSYFTEVFTRETGIPPTEYRKKNK